MGYPARRGGTSRRLPCSHCSDQAPHLATARLWPLFLPPHLHTCLSYRQRSLGDDPDAVDAEFP